MPISVVLRREQGADVRRLDVPYEAPAAAWDAAAHPLLAGVDPYGNAIFNARQMLALREEAQRLLAGEISAEERSALLGIIELCDEGQRPPHRYLWFVGD
jgi:hypothetical protein